MLNQIIVSKNGVANDPFMLVSPFEFITSESVQIYYGKFKPSCYVDSLYGELDIIIPENISESVLKRKAEFLAGRVCARQALFKILERKCDILVGSHRAPIWPDEIIGSISHSNEIAIVAATNSNKLIGLGIDVEKLISCEVVETLKNQVLFGDELLMLENRSISPSTYFTLAFSVKESFFKAAFPLVGRYFGFDAVVINDIDYKDHMIYLTVNTFLCDDLYIGRKITAKYTVLDDDMLVTYLEVQKYAKFHSLILTSKVA